MLEINKFEPELLHPLSIIISIFTEPKQRLRLKINESTKIKSTPCSKKFNSFLETLIFTDLVLAHKKTVY